VFSFKGRLKKEDTVEARREMRKFCLADALQNALSVPFVVLIVSKANDPPQLPGRIMEPAPSKELLKWNGMPSGYKESTCRAVAHQSFAPPFRPAKSSFGRQDRTGPPARF